MDKLHIKSLLLELCKEASISETGGVLHMARSYMKFGAAFGIEILQQLSENQENFPGNIPFLSFSDEEGSSAGMMDVVDFMHELQQKHSLGGLCRKRKNFL